MRNPISAFRLERQPLVKIHQMPICKVICNPPILASSNANTDEQMLTPQEPTLTTLRVAPLADDNDGSCLD